MDWLDPDTVVCMGFFFVGVVCTLLWRIEKTLGTILEKIG